MRAPSLAALVLAACGLPGPPDPSVRAVSPSQIAAREATSVDVLGDHFFSDLRASIDSPDAPRLLDNWTVTIGPALLDGAAVVRRDEHTLTVALPPLDPGRFGVIVTAPSGATARRDDALEVRCAGQSSWCGDGCYDLSGDPARCGACDHACASDETCGAGSCRPPCPIGERLCAGVCVNTSSDGANCGGCGVACANGQRCVASMCTTVCANGLTACGNSCVNLATDGANCGGCGNVCPNGQSCSGSVCKSGCTLTLCGNSCVDLTSDTANCGACGNACANGQSCVASTCTKVCGNGLTGCGNACVDLTTDGANCGACGKVCANGQSCVGGACKLVCGGGLVACGNACVDPVIDHSNCGGCGKVCPAAQTCAQGSCVCPLYQALCAGSCRPIHDDPANCGGCGKVCAVGKACVEGSCVGSCPFGLTACGGACVDPLSDASNCGGCGKTCAGGRGCVDGGCAVAFLVGPAPAKCASGGPAIILSDGMSSACLGELAAASFPAVLGSCGDSSASAAVTSDGFDSTVAVYQPGGPGGDLFTNGLWKPGATTSLGGSLVVAGGGLTLTAQMSLARDLFVAGPVMASGATVGGRAAVNGSIGGTIAITGTLTLPQGATIGGGVTAGGVVRQAVTVAPPVACGAQRLNIAGWVASVAASNDDAAIGLPPGVWVGGGGGRLDLPCGIFYLSAAALTQDTAIVGHGRTTLVIGGDLTANVNLTLLPASDAELDVVIGGKLSVGGQLHVGKFSAPASTRVWVGGPSVAVNQAALIAGALYAPYGNLTFGARAEVAGAILDGTTTLSQPTLLHQDAALKRAGILCPR